jgi:hypothetical protein
MSSQLYQIRIWLEEGVIYVQGLSEPMTITECIFEGAVVLSPDGRYSFGGPPPGRLPDPDSDDFTVPDFFPEEGQK